LAIRFVPIASQITSVPNPRPDWNNCGSNCQTVSVLLLRAPATRFAPSGTVGAMRRKMPTARSGLPLRLTRYSRESGNSTARTAAAPSAMKPPIQNDACQP
jgi:hypothetical protein